VRSTFASGLNAPYGLAFNRAGDLFEADSSGNIYKFTPGGVRSTFASGFSAPNGIAFDSAGNLFVANDGNGGNGNGTIIKITPGGVQSTFASGLNNPQQLAFNSAGNLFEADFYSSSIYEFTPGGVQSTFASGLNLPTGLAFQGIALPVPEPSALGLLGAGAALLLIRRHRYVCCHVASALKLKPRGQATPHNAGGGFP